MHVTRVGTLAAGNPSVPGSTQSSSLRYFHHDQLGSIAAISDEAGKVVERLAYDPWGKRRNTSGPSDVTDSLIGLTTDRGFTEHEHLDEMGIIHMNGRVYDPLIGRFMSADPFIQAPGNLQSYNRYAYVMNNPLNLTDPSGYSWLSRAWKRVWHNNIVQAVVTTAIAVYAGPGAAAAYTGARTWNATGSFEQGLKAGLISYGTSLAFNEVGNLGLGAGSGANILAHAAVGCASSAASGGSCRSGALAAGFAEFASPYISGSREFRIVQAAIVGGIGSRLGGGKFADGAVTAAFGYIFNQLAHETWADKYKSLLNSYDKSNPLETNMFKNLLVTIPANIVSNDTAWASVIATFESSAKTTAQLYVLAGISDFYSGVIGVPTFDPKSWLDRIFTANDAKSASELPNTYREAVQIQQSGPQVFNRSFYTEVFGAPKHPWSCYPKWPIKE
jgi:RHS repeat-associated protein